MKAIDIAPSKTTVSMQVNQTVSQLIGKMIKNKAEECLVYDGNRLHGLFSHFNMLKSRTDLAESKIRNFTVPATRVHAEADILEVAKHLLDTETRLLPVYQKDWSKIVDIYGVMDVLSQTTDKFRIYSEQLQMLDEDTALGDALHFMHNQKYREVPVGKDEKVRGILTSKRIMENYHLGRIQERPRGYQPNAPSKEHERGKLLEVPIHNFLDYPYYIKNKATIQEVAAAMAHNKSPLLIVYDDGPVGIITAEMVLREYLEASTPKIGKIIFEGTNGMHPSLLARMDKIASNQAEKLQHYFNNVYELRIHLKEKEKEGKRSRYEINALLSYPGATLTAASMDWDVITAIRKSFDKLENQLHGKYRKPDKQEKPVKHELFDEVQDETGMNA
ncbi:MAG: CBS domain-containing protein [Candidatus Woesearchaeota archaeon]